MKHLAGLLIRLIKVRGFWSLMLLLTVLLTVAVGLADVIRGLDRQLVVAVVVIGSLVGWGLAIVPLRGGAATVLISLTGLGGLLLRVGRLSEKLVLALRALAFLAWDIRHWLQMLPDAPLPNVVVAIQTVQEVVGDISALALRVYTWIRMLSVGESSFDPVAVALVWGLALWAVSSWAGWTVRRRDWALQAVAPAGALLAATFAYVGGERIFLLALLGSMLLLLVSRGYDVLVRRWRKAEIDFADLGGDIVVTSVILVLALVAMSAAAPLISVSKIVDFIRDLRSSEEVEGAGVVAQALGMDQQPGSDPWYAEVFSDARVAGLPRRHLIGSGPELSEQIVMIVSTGDIPPGPPEHMPVDPPRYYWRSLTYDRYAYQGWYSSNTEATEYSAGMQVFTPTLAATQRRVRQVVEVVGDLGGLVHQTGELLAVDQDFTVAWRTYDDTFGATVDKAVEVYKVDSLLPVVSEAELRSAGTDYPEWVESRYLALPDSVPERVLTLARDLTATELTPYDRTLAIERYLRGFPYNLDVPLPPARRDIVDYFLFELQEGYCDYYATAMVVLGRAAGLPTRYVIGYASGSYEPYEAHYVVSEANAHAWAEVYFPGYGWVEFEPTAGLPAIDRPAEAGPLDWPTPEGELGPSVGLWDFSAWLGWLRIVGAVLLLVALRFLWALAGGWWLRRMEPAATVAALYGRLQRQGQYLAVPVKSGDTPYEFASTFARWLREVTQKTRWGRWLIAPDQEVRQLVDLHVRASYSLHVPGTLEQTWAIETWKKVRWRFWMLRLLKRTLDRKRQANKA